jgi:hypothetical protein
MRIQRSDTDTDKEKYVKKKKRCGDRDKAGVNTPVHTA